MIFKKLAYGLMATALLASCVSSKKYRYEEDQRKACEAREKVLVTEVMGRRKEAADFVKQIGDLNRDLGNQDAEIRDLKKDLAARTQSMGESASKLLADKTALEKELASKKAQVEQRDNTLRVVASAQKKRQTDLEGLKNALTKAYTSGATLDQTDQAMLLTLPDQALFDKNGVLVSPTGRTLLQPLAEVLANRPELLVEIRAYTDNTLPKGIKNADDTWDWSLIRAANVTRTLIREFNINANQLSPVGKGEYFPVASNETAEGRQRNRRTVLAIFPPLPAVPSVE
ncbi:MAG: OmpA family protein [Saprospiraceae bacterium]